jgi:hypothetical protein
MANESGDMKLLGNFSKLIELISVNPDYNPANEAIKVPALNAQKTAAQAVVTDIGTKEAPYKAAINDRQGLFEGLARVVSRAGNMLQASGANKKVIDDARTQSRKITGRRKTAKVKADPNAAQNEADKSHSVSQLSYENIVGNFDNFIEILAVAPTYKPNEFELKINGLTSLSSDLKSKNEAVNTAFAPLSVARGLRDQLLYLNDDYVVNNALLVKAYVRAALGPDSQLFKSIKGLEFKRSKK